jgi:SAM-dependent methyltransferase
MNDASSLFGREYFETSYGDYERQNPPRKLRHYREVVQRFAPTRTPLRLLDVGCAFGAFLAAVDPGWQIYGVDVSEYAIGQARQYLPRAHLELVRDGPLPFAEQFDAITAWDVLEHVPKLEMLMHQIADHLTEEGAFLFAVPVYDGPLGPLTHALDRDSTHIHRRSRVFWLELASRHFHVLDWWGIFRLLVPNGYYIHWPTRALRRVAPAIAVAARRKRP